jgi:hypothetical protein
MLRILPLEVFRDGQDCGEECGFKLEFKHRKTLTRKLARVKYSERGSNVKNMSRGHI